MTSFKLNFFLYSVSPFDIYAKEKKIFGVNINPFTFPKAIGLLESLGTR